VPLLTSAVAGDMRVDGAQALSDDVFRSSLDLPLSFVAFFRRPAALCPPLLGGPRSRAIVRRSSCSEKISPPINPFKIFRLPALFPYL